MLRMGSCAVTYGVECCYAGVWTYSNYVMLSFDISNLSRDHPFLMGCFLYQPTFFFLLAKFYYCQ
uniref:Uncharacterized protein n=1 Tax=Anguilla anguilla TaxID=7936 RepID=A0A0E9WJ80_ANGAN